MSSDAVTAADKPLYEVVSGADPQSVADVIASMQAIDALLPVTNGVKWFNQLYLMVTQEVDLRPQVGAWQNPAWLTRLDVVFAKLYFRALAAFLAGQPIPAAWSALFEARSVAEIDRIQFALAGVNAHINHDLPLALLTTDADLAVLPALDSAEHQDYEAVNTLLDAVLPTALTVLATDTLGMLAQDTGKIGRVLAFWNVRKARDLAWDFADHLRRLDDVSRAAALAAQDAVTGALGRAILALR
ncbi:MAG TPA: DUF5995 family protein [Acidobacteriaceae bacterium]|nr:DUF5995 family protein [Acidobacteriaceae bacterium]